MGISKVYKAFAIGFVAAAMSVSVASADEQHSMHYVIEHAGIAYNTPKVVSQPVLFKEDVQPAKPEPMNPLFVTLRDLARRGRFEM